MKKLFICRNFVLLAVCLSSVGSLTGCGGSTDITVIAVNQSNGTTEQPLPTHTNANKNIESAPPDLSKIPTATYCDLIKNAADYDKKIVRVRAIYLNQFEKSYFYNERCETNQPPSAPKEIPAETWAEWDKSFVSQGDSEEAKLNQQLKGFGRKDITAVGRFYATDESGDANAPNRFGHLNCCRFKFSMMRVESVGELENKTVEISNEYGKTVRFASGQKIEFADFSLEYYPDLNLLVAVPQPNQKLPKHAFRATRGSESGMVYGSSDADDNAPLKFEFGGAKYQIESGISDRSGRLAKDELIVQKIN